eukprot:6380609-Amphidinium_carterae.1
MQENRSGSSYAPASSLTPSRTKSNRHAKAAIELKVNLEEHVAAHSHPTTLVRPHVWHYLQERRVHRVRCT